MHFERPDFFTHFFDYQIYHLPLSNTTVSSCTHFLLYAFFCHCHVYSLVTINVINIFLNAEQWSWQAPSSGAQREVAGHVPSWSPSTKELLAKLCILSIYISTCTVLLFYWIWLLTTTNYWAVKYILYKRTHLFQLLYGLVVILWNLYSTGSRVQFD